MDEGDSTARAICAICELYELKPKGEDAELPKARIKRLAADLCDIRILLGIDI